MNKKFNYEKNTKIVKNIYKTNLKSELYCI